MSASVRRYDISLTIVCVRVCVHACVRRIYLCSFLTTEWLHSHRNSQFPRPQGGGMATEAITNSSSCGDKEEGTYPCQL